MIKIGFSSVACPGWDLDTIISRAAEMGFDGFELRGLGGELHLPLAVELSAYPDRVKATLAEKKIELTCLGSSAMLDSRDAAKLAGSKDTIAEYAELAGRLGCPFVRVYAGEVQKRDNRRLALSRIADALISLVPVATRAGVTLLVENGGDFRSSEDLWFLIDAVDHPAVKACWNQTHAMTDGERPTTSIPRLGRKIGLVHLSDAAFEESGVLRQHLPLGEGDVGVERQIELLRGIAYDGYLMFEWPMMWVHTLAGPDVALPNAVAYIRARLDEKQAILSAYKGDKNAPNFPSSALAAKTG